MPRNCSHEARFIIVLKVKLAACSLFVCLFVCLIDCVFQCPGDSYIQDGYPCNRTNTVSSKTTYKKGIGAWHVISHLLRFTRHLACCTDL